MNDATTIDEAARPENCPFCDSHRLARCVEWEARSLDESDRGNTTKLTEWQCADYFGRSCGRSFWV